MRIHLTCEVCNPREEWKKCCFICLSTCIRYSGSEEDDVWVVSVFLFLRVPPFAFVVIFNGRADRITKCRNCNNYLAPPSLFLLFLHSYSVVDSTTTTIDRDT